MVVVPIVTGQIGENTYIVYNDMSQLAVVIDPGGDADRIVGELEERELKPTHILLTHGHWDHIGAVDALREKYGAKLVVHGDDANMMHGGRQNVFGSTVDIAEPADTLLSDDEIIKAGGLDVRIVTTPGHTMGSVCYIIGDSIFTGDTLFMQSIGRTDFPESDQNAMYESLGKLCSLEKDYTVYPGHGPSTALFEEKMYNPFLK